MYLLEVNFIIVSLQCFQRFSNLTFRRSALSTFCLFMLFHPSFVQFFGSTTFLARPHAFLPAALTFEKASVLAVRFHSNGRGRRNEIKTSFLLRYKASDQALSNRQQHSGRETGKEGGGRRLTGDWTREGGREEGYLRWNWTLSNF